MMLTIIKIIILINTNEKKQEQEEEEGRRMKKEEDRRIMTTNNADIDALTNAGSNGAATVRAKMHSGKFLLLAIGRQAGTDHERFAHRRTVHTEFKKGVCELLYARFTRHSALLAISELVELGVLVD